MQKWRKWEAAEESDWLMALKRESVLSPLATQSRPGAQRVEEAALELGLRRSVERSRPLASRSATRSIRARQATILAVPQHVLSSGIKVHKHQRIPVFKCSPTATRAMRE